MAIEHAARSRQEQHPHANCFLVVRRMRFASLNVRRADIGRSEDTPP
jgi:hypothetical protein